MLITTLEELNKARVAIGGKAEDVDNRYINKKVKKRLPVSFTPSLNAEIAPILVSNIHPVHEVIVIINELGDPELFLLFLPEHLEGGFVPSRTWWGTLPDAQYFLMTLMNRCHKENNLSIFPC